MSTETKTMATASPKSSAVAVHGRDGATHVVGLGPIKVIVCEEGGSWFAQGLDIDYASSGGSFEEVKSNFENGLAGTIDLHIKAYNGLKKFLKPAPQDVWDELYAVGGTTFDYTQISLHEDLSKALGYEQINYIKREAAAT